MTSTLVRYRTPQLCAERECHTIGEDATHYYDLIKMAFNFRLVLTPKDATGIWEYGWCYTNSLTAMAAFRVWDTDSQDEPMGWHKRATGNHIIRRAPMRELRPHYNRPRCVHGRYYDNPDRPCADFDCQEPPQ